MPSPWWTSTSTTSTRLTRPSARRSRIAVTTSLKTQKPRPTCAKAWCVPPPRFIAMPSSSAARAACSVAPVARRERSTSCSDHGRPSASSSRRSRRPSRTRSTQSALCVRASCSHVAASASRTSTPSIVSAPCRTSRYFGEREAVALRERVREDVVGEGAHSLHRMPANGRATRRQAGTGARRREPPLDRVGDRRAARVRGRAARLHLPGRADREVRPRPRGDRRHEARHGLRRALGRRSRPRLRGDGRGVRRRSRPPRPLGRVRGGRGPRGTVHRHAARPLLDGRRHQRLLARRLRPPGRAADGGPRRRLDRDDDLSRAASARCRTTT